MNKNVSNLILAIIYVIALTVLVAMDKLDPTVYISVLTLLLGYIFGKKQGLKEGAI
jgi:uncharacterized MnhB-related membrane protein